MKILLVLASLVLLTGAAPAATRKQSVNDMQKLTVLVTNEGFLGGGRGSGVLIDSMTVLTCMHMAEGWTDELFVYTYPLGRVVKAHVTNIDAAHDLALLRLDEPVKVGKKPVFQSQVYDGQPITVIGNALGSMKWFVTTGVISGQEREYLLTDARTNPGNSGGPWINDKGEIVALTDWGIGPKDHMEGVVGGVSGKSIKAFFKHIEDAKKMNGILGLLLGGL